MHAFNKYILTLNKHIHTYIHTHTHSHTLTHTCMHVCIHVRMYECMHVYLLVQFKLFIVIWNMHVLQFYQHSNNLCLSPPELRTSLFIIFLRCT